MEAKEIHELRKGFKEIVQIAGNNGFYCDINYMSKYETRYDVDKVNISIGKDNDKGIKVRVWDGHKFLESSTSSLDLGEVESLTRGLLEKAAKAQTEIGKGKELKFDKEEMSKDFGGSFETKAVSVEDRVEYLKTERDEILNHDKDIVNARAILIEEFEEHIFVNEYKDLYQKVPVILIVKVAFVNCKDGAMRTVYESFVDESFETVSSKSKKNMKKFFELVEMNKKAKKLEGGKYKVILHPKLTGLLAHESFGHGMEADTMLRQRALASSFLGKKIGGDNVNIVDYPNIPGKHGTFHFDHEGNIAKKTYLVKKGVINEPMADLYSKTNLDLENSSNSRFESFDHKHYTRMSNTYFEPGDESFEGMIKSVKDGIYVFGSSGGMEDPKGWGVQIQGNFGQRIKNGKLIDEFYDGFTLTGFLPDIVKNISGISKEFEIDGGGNCGKGHKEWVRVSDGGPYLKINEVILG